MKSVGDTMHTRLIILFFAITAFQIASAQTPEKLYHSGDLDGCIKACTKLIDKKQELPMAYLYRAMAWSKKGDGGQCIESLLKSLNDISSYLLKDASGSLAAEYTIQIDSIHANCYAAIDEAIATGKTTGARKLSEQMLKMEVLPMHLYWSARIAAAEGDAYTATSTMNKAAKMVYLQWKSGLAPDPKNYLIFEALSALLADYNDLESAIEVAFRQRSVFPETDCSHLLRLLLSNKGIFLGGCHSDSIPMLFLTTLDSLETDCASAVAAARDSVWMTYFFDNYTLTGKQKVAFLEQRNMERADLIAAALLLQVEEKTKLYHSNGSTNAELPDDAVGSYTDIVARAAALGTPISPLPRLRQLARDGNYMAVARIYYPLHSLPSISSAMIAFGDSLQAVVLQQLRTIGYNRSLYLVSLVLPHSSKQEKEYGQIAGAYIAELLENDLFTEAGALLRQELSAHPEESYLHELYKEWVIADYRKNYIGTADDKLYDWTGDPAGCEAGTIPDVTYDMVLQRLNYIRRLAGLADSCVWNPEWNTACMEAALMMTVADDLDHRPPKSWKCYSELGARAAGMSNLSLGHGGVNALMGQVYDYGGSNTSAGHRRWILHPYRRVFGMGSTTNAMALWVLGGNNSTWKADEINFHRQTPVMWPPEHYVPEALMGYRWSFSLDGASFANCVVTVTHNGAPVTITVYEEDSGYGLNTLVWDIEDGLNGSEGDASRYTVDIQGVQVDGGKKRFTYNVIFIPADGQ